MANLSVAINNVVIRIAQQFKSLAKVASSGSYSDLSNTPSIASQEQAQAGTNNTALMTPLRVKEAIEALSSSTGEVTFNTLSKWTEDPIEVFNSFYNETAVAALSEETQQESTNNIGLPEVGITGI